jgi:hypothetical protein
MSIGGYFELDLTQGFEHHPEALKLNTGRNAFEYILRAKQYHKVYLPYYTCKSMLEPIKKLSVDFEFYHIDESFRPVFDFEKVKTAEVFVYNNYFGICDTQVSDVAAKCKNLVVDNSQAFFSMPLSGVDTFYSPRKFFGLPDGAYLYTDKILHVQFEKDFSFDRCEHLLGRIDSDAETHFHTYKENSKRLDNQPIREMSNLTRRLLSSIDYKAVADKRKRNFKHLHNELSRKNKLQINVGNTEVPMIYPFLIDNGANMKGKLIKNKVFVATYWPNVLGWVEEYNFESYLTKNLITLPVDQRIELNDLTKILNQLREI